MIPRWAEKLILESLKVFDVTVLVGPRQSGKTTLCEAVANKTGMIILSLDNPDVLTYAENDPLGFIEDHPKAFIDEIQRLPKLIFTIKYCVDKHRKPHQYLISGSVDLWNSKITPDSLAGRSEMLTLLPLARSEIYGKPPSSLIAEAFQGNIKPFKVDKAYTNYELAGLICQGGYPLAINKSSPAVRKKWLVALCEFVATHDLPVIKDLRKKDLFLDFIKYLAYHPAMLMNLDQCASVFNLSAFTIRNWLNLLENMFIIKRLPAWHKNYKKRLGKTPKYHFVDTGIIAALQDLDELSLSQDPKNLGHLLENLIYTELIKIIPSLHKTTKIYHYRDHNNYEVDFVLEQSNKLIGIEVKSARTIEYKDLNGLRNLKNTCKDNFVCGIILHRGTQVSIRHGNLYLVPINKLF